MREEDPLGPARGCLVGILGGLLILVGILFLITLLAQC
jgi:hypothetical protein